MTIKYGNKMKKKMFDADENWAAVETTQNFEFFSNID
jgi:hypothetical protein